MAAHASVDIAEPARRTQEHIACGARWGDDTATHHGESAGPDQPIGVPTGLEQLDRRRRRPAPVFAASAARLIRWSPMSRCPRACAPTAGSLLTGHVGNRSRLSSPGSRAATRRLGIGGLDLDAIEPRDARGSRVRSRRAIESSVASRWRDCKAAPPAARAHPGTVLATSSSRQDLGAHRHRFPEDGSTSRVMVAKPRPDDHAPEMFLLRGANTADTSAGNCRNIVSPQADPGRRSASGRDVRATYEADAGHSRLRGRRAAPRTAVETRRGQEHRHGMEQSGPAPVSTGVRSAPDRPATVLEHFPGVGGLDLASVAGSNSPLSHGRPDPSYSDCSSKGQSPVVGNSAARDAQVALASGTTSSVAHRTAGCESPSPMRGAIGRPLSSAIEPICKAPAAGSNPGSSARDGPAGRHTSLLTGASGQGPGGRRWWRRLTGQGCHWPSSQHRVIHRPRQGWPASHRPCASGGHGSAFVRGDERRPGARSRAPELEQHAALAQICSSEPAVNAAFRHAAPTK